MICANGSSEFGQAKFALRKMGGFSMLVLITLNLRIIYNYKVDCEVDFMSNNPYQQPDSYAVPQALIGPRKNQTLAIISLVTGILSLTTGCPCGFFVPLSLISIITGLLGMQKISRGTGEGYGMALWGVILGSIALLLYGTIYFYLFYVG